MSIFKNWGIKSWVLFAVLWLFAVSAAEMVYQLSSAMEKLTIVALAASIVALDNRESEFLRAAYLLYNASLIDAQM